MSGINGRRLMVMGRQGGNEWLTVGLVGGRVVEVERVDEWLMEWRGGSV